MSERGQMITTRNVFDIDPTDAALPLGDRKAVLAMQATGLYVAGDDRFAAVNASLYEVAAAAGAPPAMTYRDLVFTAPVEAGAAVPVLSEDPEVAAGEGSFYVAHREMEHDLYGTVGALRAEEFKQAAERLGGALQTMISLHKGLTREMFARFRPFFNGINGYPGPSGQYSESIPILDLLIHGGQNLSPEEREQVRSNLDEGLYPDHEGHAGMLEDLLDDPDPRLDMPADDRRQLIQGLNTLRRTHRGSVKKLIPEVLAGEAEGTGGTTDVRSYLGGKVLAVEGQDG